RGPSRSIAPLSAGTLCRPRATLSLARTGSLVRDVCPGLHDGLERTRRRRARFVQGPGRAPGDVSSGGDRDARAATGRVLAERSLTPFRRLTSASESAALRALLAGARRTAKRSYLANLARISSGMAIDSMLPVSL